VVLLSIYFDGSFFVGCVGCPLVFWKTMVLVIDTEVWLYPIQFLGCLFVWAGELEWAFLFVRRALCGFQTFYFFEIIGEFSCDGQACLMAANYPYLQKANDFLNGAKKMI